MRITKEIKAKIIATFIGVEFKCIAKSFQIGNKILKGIILNDNNDYVLGLGTIEASRTEYYAINEWVPMLKPLYSITDKDALKVTEILITHHKIEYVSNFLINRDHIPRVQVCLSNEDGDNYGGTVNIHFCGVIDWDCSEWKDEITTYELSILKAYQYLQSKGYDLPQYLLNGKTLHEAGLATYQ